MNSAQGLTDFERCLVTTWCDKFAPPLKEFLSDIVVARREITGVGFYTYFNHSKRELPGIKEHYKSHALFFDLSNNRSGGAILYIENGNIDMLEVFSNGSEPIDFNEEQFVIAEGYS